MKIKTSELQGAALDYVVAKLEDLPLRYDPMAFGKQAAEGGYWVWPDSFPPNPAYMKVGRGYSPSTNWAQGGPIIEREKIELYRPLDISDWQSAIPDGEEAIVEFGPTPLIAAMRCYVASKLGDEVEIPEALA